MVRTFRISFTHVVFTSAVGACNTEGLVFSCHTHHVCVCYVCVSVCVYLYDVDLLSGVAPDLKLLVVSLGVLSDAYSTHLENTHTHRLIKTFISRPKKHEMTTNVYVHKGMMI